MLERDKLQPS